MQDSRRILVLLALVVLPTQGLWAQAQSPEERARLDQLAREDHADMMSQLGITKLRPGPNGRAAAGEPNAANYDPAKANPYPDCRILTLKEARRVTTPASWWHKRRPEVALDFEREVDGRVPKNAPNVTWTVAQTARRPSAEFRSSHDRWSATSTTPSSRDHGRRQDGRGGAGRRKGRSRSS